MNSVQAYPEDVAELRRLDQPDRIDDDHRRQRRFRHQLDERREKEHRAERGQRGDHAGELRPGTRQPVHGGLRRASAAGHRAEQRAAEVCQPRRQQLAVRLRRRLAALAERAARRDGFGEAHQRDAERGRQECRQHGGVRPCQGRQPRRHVADGRHAVIRQAEQFDGGNPGGHCDQGRGRTREPMLQGDQQADHDRPDSHGRERGLRQPLDDGKQVVKQRAFVEMNAEQLRQLIHDDHDADASLEADQHRLRNEIRDEAQPQQSRQDEDGPYQERQRRRRRHQGGRIARARLLKCRRDQDREGGRRADTERTRRAQQGIDQHRQKGRIEPDLNRQAGDGRIGERLRNDDRRHGQPRDGVGPQPLLSVVAKPLRQGHAYAARRTPTGPDMRLPVALLLTGQM